MYACCVYVCVCVCACMCACACMVDELGVNSVPSTVSPCSTHCLPIVSTVTVCSHLMWSVFI